MDRSPVMHRCPLRLPVPQQHLGPFTLILAPDSEGTSDCWLLQAGLASGLYIEAWGRPELVAETR